MLRSSLLRGSRHNLRAIVNRSRPELVQGVRIPGSLVNKRFYAEKKPDETVIPGSESKAPKETVPPPQETAKVASTATSPNPASAIPPTGTVSAPPPPPKKTGRIRRFLVNLIILSTLGYGIAVYYALTTDNFHDFFTEYVPFGEDVVAYFEEREFRKRFLKRPQESRLHPQVRGEAKVTIPGRAGVSVKNVETSDLGGKGRHSSAVEEQKTPDPHPQTLQAQKTNRDNGKPAQAAPVTAAPATKAEGKPEAKPSPQAAAAVAEPAKSEPIQPVDKLEISHASEPVVQDIVKILNDIITVINADNASGKYGSTIDKAKGELSKVIADIDILKQKEKKEVEGQLLKLHSEFDEAARELLRRTEQQMQDMEMRWREEYETERENISKAYDSKLDEELSSAKQVYDKMLENELLKQAIAIRRGYSESVKETVESEREGRLSKLDELSSNVAELERLTGEWNAVVDSTMNTQHLLVAVEAVRASLENSDRPKPFTSELAALKEVAANNPVVDAAIASVNPLAYQRGIPTSAQLIDRFRRVASEVRKAALLPDNAGVASHAASLLLSKVMFKKGGLPVGDDVESILTRAEVFLEEGNLDSAVQEMTLLSGWAKTLSRDWLVESRRVLEVQQALDVISTEARLRSLLVD